MKTFKVYDTEDDVCNNLFKAISIKSNRITLASVALACVALVGVAFSNAALAVGFGKFNFNFYNNNNDNNTTTIISCSNPCVDIRKPDEVARPSQSSPPVPMLDKNRTSAQINSPRVSSSQPLNILETNKISPLGRTDKKVKHASKPKPAVQGSKEKKITKRTQARLAENAHQARSKEDYIRALENKVAEAQARADEQRAIAISQANKVAKARAHADAQWAIAISQASKPVPDAPAFKDNNAETLLTHNNSENNVPVIGNFSGSSPIAVGKMTTSYETLERNLHNVRGTIVVP